MTAQSFDPMLNPTTIENAGVSEEPRQSSSEETHDHAQILNSGSEAIDAGVCEIAVVDTMTFGIDLSDIDDIYADQDTLASLGAL